MSSVEKIALIFFSLLLVIFLFKEKEGAIEVLHKEYKTVLAFGDSLTFGYGTVASQSYPSHLSNLLGVEVINEGISGEVSSDGLKRLPKLLKEYQPDLIIICHGGNDILRKVSKEVLRQNLESMVQISQAVGVDVLLVAVPNLSLFGLDVMPLYEEISQKYNTLFEEDILSKTLSNSDLKSDQIHPNAQGYLEMAKAFRMVIQVD